MTEPRRIALSRLRLDALNPRLDDGQQSQRETMSAMLRAQSDKLVALARDIVKSGLSPLDRFLVVDADDESGDYVVLEGNRRLASLKLLLNPEFADGALGARDLKTIRELSASAQVQADSELDCVVVDSRDDAVHWLRLRHGGQLDGAGTVDWGATERERFESRSGRRSPELQLINFAIAHGVLTQEEANAVSITNLRRLLSDRHVRETIGVDIDRKAGRITTRYPLAEIAKPTTKLLRDLASDGFRVAKIYTKEDRELYMKGFGPRERPNKSTVLPAPVDVLAQPGSGTGGIPVGRSASRTGGRIATARSTVAPSRLSLYIDTNRIKDLYRELQRLKVEEYPNAGAVLLRVFLELTVDRYIKRRRITLKQHSELAKKLQAVHDDLLANAAMTKAELAPIRKAISGNDLMAASISLFNLYVHEFHLSPSPSDVRTSWNNLELFFTRVWT